MAMHCSLVDLSDELHLKIIQELLEHDQLFHEQSLPKERELDYRDRDDEFQYHRDLMNWSCTSRYFRNLLAPYIFTSIKLRNDEKSGASVDALLKGRHGVLVKEIYFLGTIPSGAANPDDSVEDDALAEGFNKKSHEAGKETGKSVTITLPPVVDDILSHLHQYSNLETLSIGFTYPYDNIFDEYYDNEDPEMSSNPEAARDLHALMTKTYNTLLRNNKLQLRAVEIRKFVWIFTDPYESQSFHDFLSHVENFTLSVRGGDNGAGWCINTCDEYLECVASFDELFFNHLASATILTLRAPYEGPIGLDGFRHARLALRKEQMPLLKSLNLEHIFICQELVDFVTSHSDSLEQLTLHDCNGRPNSSQDSNDGFYWNHFFDALRSANLKQLSYLEIRPYNAPLSWEETYEPPSFPPKTEQVEPENVQQIRRSLNADPRRRVFGYATLDDKYGACDVDEEETVAAIERGEDQVAFDRLMGNVNANAATEKANPVGE